MALTAGTVADCCVALPLIEGLQAQWFIADKAYDTDAIVAALQALGMEVVIPPKKNRIVQRPYDQYIYKLRHLVENTFLKLKSWRGVATRYAKRSSSFLAFLHIACAMLWLKIS